MCRRLFPYSGLISCHHNDNSITVLMAELAAEKAVTGNYADGGSSDIQNAIARACAMTTQFGMSKHGFAGAGIPAETNQEINERLQDGFQRASELIQENRDKLERMVELLLQGEDLADEQISALFAP